MKDEHLFRVCTPLTKEITIAGGDRRLVILNTTLTIAIFQGTGNYMVFPIGFILHILIIYLTKKDQNTFMLFIRYLKKKKYYHS